MNRYLLYSSFFDLTNPGGGAVFSMDIAREWLSKGNEVHVICASPQSGRNISDLGQYVSSGKLHIHELISYSALSFPHVVDRRLHGPAKALLSRYAFNEIHVHNFHGLLGALDATTGIGVPTIYTALDFGMTCFNFYRYDGSLEPCNGPEPDKCRKCLVRFEKMGVKSFTHHAFGILKKLFGISGTGHRKYFDLSLHRYLRNIPNELGSILSILNRFDRVIAPSPAIQESMKKFRKDQSGIQAILYPVSPLKIASKETTIPTNDKPIKLVFLANDSPVKGWDFFLNVLATLPDGLNLEVIDGNGNTRSFERASESARRYLKDSKRWRGDEVKLLLKDCDAVLVPSLWHENTPLVILESLANNRPVIASDQLGIRHLIQEKMNGFLLPPGELRPWAELLISLCNDPAALRSMRKNCHYEKTVPNYLNEVEQFTGKNL